MSNIDIIDYDKEIAELQKEISRLQAEKYQKRFELTNQLIGVLSNIRDDKKKLELIQKLMILLKYQASKSFDMFWGASLEDI